MEQTNVRCWVCCRPAKWLCDAVVARAVDRPGELYTCDRGLCDEHTVQRFTGYACSRGHGCKPITLDLCPDHVARVTPVLLPAAECRALVARLQIRLAQVRAAEGKS